MTNDKFIRILLFGLLFGFAIVAPTVEYFISKYDQVEQDDQY